MEDSIKNQAHLAQLMDQIDFFITERLKILALKKQETESLIGFSVILKPSILLIQSSLLGMNEEYNHLNLNINQNVEQLIPTFSNRLQSLFLNYLSIKKLRDEIDENSNAEKKRIQLQQFHENLKEMEKPQLKLIENLYETFLMEYNIGIDSAFSTFKTYYRDFVKITDSFQLKIAQYNNIMSKLIAEAKEFDNFTQFPNLIQVVEDELSEFQKGINIIADHLIYGSCQRFEQVVKNILTYIRYPEKETESTSSFVEDQYQEIQIISEQLNESLLDHIESYFAEESKQLDIAIHNITLYTQEHLDFFAKIRPEPDPSIIQTMEKIDKKLKELLLKKEKLSKAS